MTLNWFTAPIFEGIPDGETLPIKCPASGGLPMKIGAAIHYGPTECLVGMVTAISPPAGWTAHASVVDARAAFLTITGRAALDVEVY